MRLGLCARILVLLTCAGCMASCGTWCRLRGGRYQAIVPPDDDDTRMCVMPQDPARDAGKSCSDNDDCAKGCLCSEELTDKLGRRMQGGASIEDINASRTPATDGRCAAQVNDSGFSCHINGGTAVVDMVLI